MKNSTFKDGNLSAFFTEGEKRQLRAYYAAQAADEAWSNELQRVFGRDAGTARYQARGVSTPRLAELHDAWRKAMDSWRELFLAAG